MNRPPTALPRFLGWPRAWSLVWLLAGLVAIGGGCATEAPTDWSYLHASVITPNCTISSCHAPLSRAGGFSLTHADEAFLALTGRACAEDDQPAAGFVNVTAPTESYLSILLRRQGPTGMPPNGRLAAVELGWIEAWMADGALCDARAAVP